MRFSTLQAVSSASVLLSAQTVLATHSHRHAHSQYGRRHAHSHHAAEELVDAPVLEKRTTCSLPNDPDLVYISGASNNGFAMSPDQVCADGSYCPIACVSGKVMNQWQPNSTYVYPQSMNGGLYCNKGTPEKPFPGSPYCVEGTGTVQAVNNCGKVVSFCQTVLPGNEAMLIPTDVTSTATLAVPGINYWDSTAAHYYINPPGVTAAEGCIWGDDSKDIGNWSPYVAGANTDASGLTYVKIGWNPIYTDCDWVKTKPSYGVKIECPSGGCNGLPCSINPATDGVGGVESNNAASGAGGASFCVVTVPKGGSANIVVFNTDGSTGSVSSSSSAAPSSSTKPVPSPSSSAVVTSSKPASTSSTASAYSSTSTTSAIFGGIFHENDNSTTAYQSATLSSHATTTKAPTSGSTVDSAAPVSTTSKNDGAADQGGAAFAGLVVALVAAAALY